MHLVERMTLDPNRCIGCGAGNVPDGETGQIGPFIDLEMEIGWNDHAYLCTNCGVKVGALAGMISEDEKVDLARRVRTVEAELHEKSAELDQTVRRLKGTQKRLLKVS
jgi:hypothetical protein